MDGGCALAPLCLSLSRWGTSGGAFFARRNAIACPARQEAGRQSCAMPCQRERGEPFPIGRKKSQTARLLRSDWLRKSHSSEWLHRRIKCDAPDKVRVAP
ncbi:hypothetical protein PR003_g4990 [Phytophthora rubi]|uniref:Uncharacterized protein n=2 Tax=Phytophthora TaxID=4783 RepID=A0A6A3NRZ1_9STRA|nr:hypothetical protein PR002_g5550 [Phytophthora rubi]KAE9047316.1 hypothetical protein PR001_g4251 [Phytophthora rubi]KAE9316702.1 hypothetical protein PF008_g18935 [Phytophthora fragariae]KAE9351216.1 hypothetical protein PR003_g4990 [Phytophthora rubi]